ncbi:VanZ family protein [Streptomyces sp. NPDC088354]|uniref:VanZ family protein n=1 Tax=unclassified Streptomyces TaxID=2593676 RepID=UPI0029A06396|nr:VanZ family protein [Streptomyces sp. MI02-7b]MDX3071978.1 VanZ family protein [Streptomyces sp. MI02-7b]
MGLILAAVHLTLVGWLLLRPQYVAWVDAPNLRPLATIRTDLALPPLAAARALGAGLVLLAPLGVLLPMAGGRAQVSAAGSFARTVFAGLMISLTLEFMQTGVPGQIFDVDALLLNTAGVALTHLAVVPAARAWLRRRGARVTAPGPAGSRGRTPRISRVGVAP